VNYELYLLLKRQIIAQTRHPSPVYCEVPKLKTDLCNVSVVDPFFGGAGRTASRNFANTVYLSGMGLARGRMLAVVQKTGTLRTVYAQSLHQPSNASS
jgi:hypothetical protein